MRVSAERPGWSWSDILMQPAEPPFGPDSPVRSIRIDYPGRDSWTCRRRLVAGLLFRRLDVLRLLLSPAAEGEPVKSACDRPSRSGRHLELNTPGRQGKIR